MVLTTQTAQEVEEAELALLVLVLPIPLVAVEETPPSKVLLKVPAWEGEVEKAGAMVICQDTMLSMAGVAEVLGKSML